MILLVNNLKTGLMNMKHLADPLSIWTKVDLPWICQELMAIRGQESAVMVSRIGKLKVG